MSLSAAQLKDKGNDLFRSGSFARAEELYAKAEGLDPKSPTYPSNQSAALYEQGKYFETLKAIGRSYANLTDDTTKASILPKLSTRLAKSLACGVRDGIIPLHNLEGEIKLINDLRIVSEADDALPECKRAWNEWKRVAQDFDRVQKGGKEARRRLTTLPVRKETTASFIEFYTVGQDHLMSLLHDWGPGDKDKRNPVDISRMSEERLSRLAFYFGGVGDGRHVLGSIIGLSQARLKLNKRKRQAMQAHLTMNDIHPSALARDLCLLSLLDELSSSQDNQTKVAEVKMTLISLWMGCIMPLYCFTRLKKTMKLLMTKLQATPPQLPDWLFVAPEGIPRIIAALKYWDTGLTSKTTQRLLQLLRNKPGIGNMVLNDPTISPSWQKTADQKAKERREQTKMYIDMTMPDDQIISSAESSMGSKCPGPNQPERRQEWLKKARKQLYEMMISMDTGANGTGSTGPGDLVYEREIQTVVPCFISPPILQSRDAPLALIYNGLRDGQEPWSDTDIMKMRKYVDNTWRPNPTLFDPLQEKSTGYPEVNFNPLDFVNMLDAFNDRMRIYRGHKRIDKACPTYSILSTFFDGVNDALGHLKGHVKLEILLGDANEGLAKIRNGDVVGRPPNFPDRFTRIWLSNCPDYTGGPLAMAVLTMPSLEVAPDAALAANCLMNSGIWETGDQFVHNYTQLNCKDYARFFGCRILTMDPAWGNMEYAQEPLPRPLDKLPSREELTTWLTRVLVNILAPCKTGSGLMKRVRVRYPNNLTMFICLLIRLHAIGYPSHWLSDYLQSILRDVLITTVVPYLGDAPIPLSQMTKRGTRRQLNLHPWRVELETILAYSYEAIPFPVSFPDDFIQTHEDVATFEAPAPAWSASTLMYMYGYDPVFTLIFFKDGNSSMIMRMREAFIPEVLEGKHLKKGDIYIVGTVDLLGVGDKVVRWRMSKERVRQMQEERWSMVAHRFDLNETSMSFVPSSTWKVVNTNA